MHIFQNNILKNATIVVECQVEKVVNCVNFNVNFENRIRRRKQAIVKTLTVKLTGIILIKEWYG